jgi:hypothetical protein
MCAGQLPVPTGQAGLAAPEYYVTITATYRPSKDRQLHRIHPVYRVRRKHAQVLDWTETLAGDFGVVVTGGGAHDRLITANIIQESYKTMTVTY